MPGLPNSRRKIARAKEHRDDLEKRFLEFWSAHRQTAFFEPDPQESGYEIFKIRIIDNIPMDSFTNIVEDAVVNLRSALDGAGYALAIGAGRVLKPRSTGFPFADSPTNLENQIKGRSKDIPEELYSTFRGYQPYRGGNDALWALNEACNFTKHQGLIKLNVGTALGNVDGFGPLVKLLSPPRWDKFSQEIEIGTAIKASEIHYDIEIGASIAFDEIDVIGGEPVLGVIDYFIEIVEHIISTLEVEGTRLGFLK
jgi:hypothetical protein